MTDLHREPSTSATASGVRGYWPLILAVAVGLGAALLSWRSPSQASMGSQLPSGSLAKAPRAESPLGPVKAAKNSVSGQVLERLDVARYTYLRLAGPSESGDGTWVAVATAAVRVGDRVQVQDAELMSNFVSPTLKRTFSTIYFGVLAEAPGSAIAHHLRDATSASVAPSTKEMPSPANPHGASGEAASGVTVGKVSKAKGPLGRTVADIHAQRAVLQGKVVRVRGVVVKSTSGVMGRSFVHVRDGSGSVQGEDHDLTATTAEEPKIGTNVLLEGKLTVQRDFGAGYSYPVLLEDARIVVE